MVNVWSNGVGQFRYHSEIVDEDGNLVTRTDEESFDLPDLKHIVAHFTSFRPFRFPAADSYKVVVLLDGHPVQEYWLYWTNP